jgi:RNA polymerase sigma factor (sigma-70 family)
VVDGEFDKTQPENQPRGHRPGRPDLPGPESPTAHIFARHQAGDAHARSDFYRRYATKLVPLARSAMSERLRSRHAPEDIVQEAISRSLRYMDPLEREYSPEIMSFFCVLIRQVAADFAKAMNARKRSAHGEVSMQAGESPMDIPGQDATPSRIISRDEQRARLRICMQRIAPDHRRVLELRIQRKMSLEQVAAEFGRRVEAITMLEKRARVALRHCMQDGDDHAPLA